MLKCTKISKSFGKLVAVENVSFDLKKSEILGLIGPNGSGKTTLLNIISGILRTDSGRIYFEEKDITKFLPRERCWVGINKTNQIVRPFWKMSALDNVVVGSLNGKDRNISLSEAKEEALRWLDFLGISRKADSIAQSLTHNDLRMLELARALATKPKILLIDETLAGLNPVETRDALKIITKIRDELDITIIWVEHKMKELMNTAERVIVFDYGKKIAEGSPKEVANNREVIDVYLGAT